jgi:hypothetical protein
MIALFTKCGRGNRTGLHLPGPGCEGPARLRCLVDRVARLVREKQQPRRHHDDRTEYGQWKVYEIAQVARDTIRASIWLPPDRSKT